jgi:hypothetical protein
VLRYLGQSWGLPSPTHAFSYHPDEFHSLRGALSLLLAGDWNPHFFNYGSLYLYLVALAAALADCSAVGKVTPEGLTQMLHDWTVAARNLNLICALLTVIVVFLIARELVGKRLGLWAALALAVMPLHVLHSDYATVDVPQAMFIALALLFAVKIGKHPRTSSYLWAGIFAGLAASVKYNGIVVLLAPLVAHFVASREEEPHVKLLSWQPLAMLALAAAAFALTSPFTFLDFNHAQRDIMFELQHMRLGEEPARSADPNGWLFHWWGLTITSAGATVAAIVGIIGLIVRKAWRPGLAVIVFGLVWFAMISLSQVRYGRYDVPLTPVLAVLLAAAPAAWQARRTRLRPLVALLALAAIIAMLLPPAVIGLGLANSLTLGLRLRQDPDPRDQALALILQTVPPGRDVGLAWEPWFNGPPLDRCNGGAVLRTNPLWGSLKAPVRPLKITGLNPAALTTDGPFAFALSNFEIRDALRVGDQGAEQFHGALRQDYAPTAVLQRNAPLAGVLGWVPPQDWLYPFPTETVYLAKIKTAPTSGATPKP